jgi:hypothetical protein
LMGQLKRELLNLKLPLEKINWVLHFGAADAMDGHAVGVDGKGVGGNVFIQSVNDGVHFFFEVGQFVVLSSFEGIDFGVHE